MTASDVPRLAIDSGWLVEEVDEHTCGTGRDGHYGAHEPGCGLVPVMTVAALVGLFDTLTAVGLPINRPDLLLLALAGKGAGS